MEVVDGLNHADEFRNKHFEVFLLEKLIEDKKSFFNHAERKSNN